MGCSRQLQEQALRTLKELVKIKSAAEDPVVTPSGEKFPFGQGVQDAFAYMLSEAERLGFKTEDVDHYGGHIEFGEGQEILGLPGHLDVVPAEGQWSFDPWCGDEQDGYILGRGITDDKGPMVACLYAMKSLMDEGYEPARRVRLILGLDEETNWEGMRHYLEKAEMPDFGFSPDGEFPIINGEKGNVQFHLARKLGKPSGKGLILTRLSGGTARNIVPDSARAVIRWELQDAKEKYQEIRSMLREFCGETGYRLKARGMGKSLEITAEGHACHGADPQDGVNAIAVLIEFLGRLDFVSDDLTGFIDFYNNYIAFDPYGGKLGIDRQDPQYGKLTVNSGVIAYDRDSVSISMDIRFPGSVTTAEIYDKIQPVLDQYSIGVVKGREEAPFRMDPADPLPKALIDVYREITGDKDNPPKVVGQATYAQSCRNTLAYGALFPGDPDIMHQVAEGSGLEQTAPEEMD